jgi:hypothetical protein
MNKTLLTAILIALATTTLFAQKRQTNYKVEGGIYIAKDNKMPFWMISNKNGIIPNESAGIAEVSIFSNFKPNTTKLQFSYGIDIVSQITKSNKNTIVSQLYGSLKWRNIQLDLGVKHQPIKFQGLSSTNGNLLWSNNSRSYPGYCLKLADYTRFRFMPKWLSFKMEYGDYILNDNRYMGDRTRLHHKNLFLKARLSEKLSIIGGIDHYAMWAGESEALGEQPSGLKDYLKVITGASGGDDALMTDQINAIGNHLGNYTLKIVHKGKTDWTFFYTHPFEDGSGREFQNYPDGNYGIFIDRKKDKAFINYFLYEFTNTMHQSGNFVKKPGDPSDLHRGNDSYFHNSVYRSGYTYFNRIMGSPFFIPMNINEKGITPEIKSNRFIAHHIGLKGHLFKFMPYKLMLSTARNYGAPLRRLSDRETNYHGLFEIEIKQHILPFTIVAGTAYSRYTYQGNTPSHQSYGAYIRVFKKGIF